jgi:calcineurin-like phosphoesterase family protein
MKTYLVSDTHFGHANILTFKDAHGEKLRPWDYLQDMHNAMIKNWNSVVSPEDKVYHLGDVAIHKRGLDVLRCLNGRKVLIKGNHDIHRLAHYSEHFYDIRAYHVLDGFVLSHVPIHPDSLERWKGNFHGHLHSNRVMKDEAIDPRYFNVSVEQINFTPILFDEAKRRLISQ